jgi:hypothetical protein
MERPPLGVWVFWAVLGATIIAVVFATSDGSRQHLALIIQMISAMVAAVAAYFAYKAVELSGQQVAASRESMRRAHHLELEKRLLDMNSVFIENPDVWSDYIFKGNETEEQKKQMMLDKMIYWYVNYFCILFWSCRDNDGTIKPEESNYWSTWDAFIKDYVERHPRVVELLSNPKVEQMYSPNFIEYIKSIGKPALV